MVMNILLWSVLGILGSFSVAWFGMRINTYANARTAFASLKGKAFPVMSLPLRSGMSIGVLLICVELVMMIIILLFIPRENAGACFIGFAIGESLGASALRICGGIFTKIADIGADLMKIIFKIDEDDARNPGVIADCTGDNAGDSVGPTADGFETYGVTGVALISFIVLAAGMSYTDNGSLALMADGIDIQARLIVWIFTMRLLMIITSVVSYMINNWFSKLRFGNKQDFDFEVPLTSLVWITSLLSIAVTFGVSYVMIGGMGEDLWWKLSVIISCGTLAAALIPEFTKIFTSSKSKHVQEIVDASREAGASLNIISGIVAGNFSAFWKGLVMIGLMTVAYFAAAEGLDDYMVYPTVFAFGLVAFGMLGMGPVTIAVDSYGPVTDNAQSVFELSQIEQIKDIDKEIEKDYGFKPDFETGKELLEVWYYGDLLTVKGEPQSYIVDGDAAPGLVAARDPESGEEFVIFDGGRHGYDNMFCDEHDPSELEHRPLKRYEIPASKLVLELGYSIDYEDEKETFEPDEADTVELINGERMPWEQAKRDGIDYIALYYVNEKGKPVQILDAELA